VFESVIFLFLVHPYDVGDGIILANSTEFLIVRRAQPLLPFTSRVPDCSARRTMLSPDLTKIAAAPLCTMSSGQTIRMCPCPATQTPSLRG